MKQKRISRNLRLLTIVALLGFPPHFGYVFAGQKATRPPRSAKRAVQVIELRNLEPLKEAFRRDRGKVRLVTILSPT